MATFGGDSHYKPSDASGDLLVTQVGTVLGSVSGTAAYGGTATLTATLTAPLPIPLVAERRSTSRSTAPRSDRQRPTATASPRSGRHHDRRCRHRLPAVWSPALPAIRTYAGGGQWHGQPGRQPTATDHHQRLGYRRLRRHGHAHGHPHQHGHRHRGLGETIASHSTAPRSVPPPPTATASPR